MTGPKLLDGRAVSRRLTLKAGTLSELVQAGKVEQREGGKYDLEEVRRAIEESEQSREEETTVLTSAGTRRDELATSLAEKVLAREQRMFEMYATRVERLVESLERSSKSKDEEIDRLRAEQHTYHEERLKGFDAQEKLLSRSHERDMLERMVEHRQAATREGLALLKSSAPTILKYVRMSAEGRDVARKLFDSITDEQIAAIISIDFLTDEQKADLQKLVAMRAASKVDATPAPATNGASVAHTNGE